MLMEPLQLLPPVWPDDKGIIHITWVGEGLTGWLPPLDSPCVLQYRMTCGTTWGCDVCLADWHEISAQWQSIKIVLVESRPNSI